MKYLRTVTTVQEIELHLNPDINWDELVTEFSDTIFEIDSIGELIAFASRYLSQHSHTTFIEGIGKVEPYWNQPFEKDVAIHYNVEMLDSDVELV